VARTQQPAGRRVQLHRALSKLGLASRTQAREFIRAGEVTVDGRVVTDPLAWVDLDRQRIAWHGREAVQPPPVVLALHKPRGVVTTRADERGRRTVYDLLPEGLPWVFPAGRLDADSEGLLILTNDSQLASRLTEPERHVPRTYHVAVRGTPAEESLEQLRRGIDYGEGMTRSAGVRVLGRQRDTTLVEMVLTEGRNRQVRRMWAAKGHKVVRLRRVAIGSYALNDLAPGECRVLDAEAVRRLTGE
jgi:23S rRNA pseudouridine2605 synthase